MDLRPLKTETDYERALAEIERHFDCAPARHTAVAMEFDALAALIEAYEARHWPIEATTAGSLG